MTEAEQALEKLGQRLRAGFARKHPARNLDAVRDAVREQYEHEQQQRQHRNTGKDNRQPPEPDQEH